MAGFPPDYDNVRWGGPDGLRVPQEVGKATLVVKREVTLSVTSGTITLPVDQAGSSYFSVLDTGATTLVFPSLPGHEFIVNNLAASAGSVTVEVASQSATAIAVAAGHLQHFVIDSALGVIPVAAAVAV
jgi:hypothetical protein